MKSLNKRLLIITFLSLWLIIIIFFMLLGLTINLEVFFVLWLIGLLILVEMADNHFVRPGFIKGLMVLAGIGTMIFGLIVIHKIWVILSS